MISAADVLHIIGETHQFSILILELKSGTTFGITHSSNGKLTYFHVPESLTASRRRSLVEDLSKGALPESLKLLAVEDFLSQLEGNKARHIWLETIEERRRELAFASISELKNFLQTHSRRQ